RRWFRDTSLPLNTKNGAHEYGSALWLHYLTKRLNSVVVVRSLWEQIVQEPALSAMKTTLQNSPYNLPFAQALQEFYTWCYFTNYRADEVEYFAEGADYPSVQYETTQILSEKVSFAGTLSPLAAEYYRFIRTAQEVQGNLQIASDPGRFGLTGIAYNQNDEYFVRNGYGLAPVLLPRQTRQDTVVFVVVHGSLPPSGAISNDYELQLTLGEQIDLDDALEPPFPNPFRPRNGTILRVPYRVKQATTVETIIFSEEGRVVRKEKSRTRLPAGSYEFVWDGEDDTGQLVPSGVYVLRLIAGSFGASTKIVVINR
ncbi:MAG: FlgD immunoglobulin-like domain containing protein, partial [candidate division KSB1 bacterium]